MWIHRKTMQAIAILIYLPGHPYPSGPFAFVVRSEQQPYLLIAHSEGEKAP